MINQVYYLKAIKPALFFTANVALACMHYLNRQWLLLQLDSTLTGLIADLKPVIQILETANVNIRASSVSSACSMFLEYITYSDNLHQNQVIVIYCDYWGGSHSWQLCMFRTLKHVSSFCWKELRSSWRWSKMPGTKLCFLGKLCPSERWVLMP